MEESTTSVEVTVPPNKGMITDWASDQKAFKGGKVYDPRRGKTYKSKLHLNDDGTLRVEGCLAFICDGENWRPLDIIINEDGTKEGVLRRVNKEE